MEQVRQWIALYLKSTSKCIFKLVSVFVILALFLAFITSCSGRGTRPAVALNYLARQIENGEIGDIELTIYYMEIVIFVSFPISVDSLLDGRYEEKIVVCSEELGMHMDLLNSFVSINPIPVRQSSVADIRVYYVFSQNGNVILDVAMWGRANTNVFVNGHEVEWNNAFLGIIEPFLPEGKSATMRQFKELPE